MPKSHGPDIFYSRITIDPATECWNYVGPVKGSYPGFARHYAHRYSYELHVAPIPPGLCVRHRCDNRQCVNPDHLALGTQADNLCDMRSRGRARHGVRTLTTEQVVEIRHAEGRICDIAEEYGVTPVTIWHVRTGRTHRKAGGPITTERKTYATRVNTLNAAANHSPSPELPTTTPPHTTADEVARSPG